MHRTEAQTVQHLLSGQQQTIGRSDTSTKPSTTVNEKEPIPSFIKAISNDQNEIFEEEQETYSFLSGNQVISEHHADNNSPMMIIESLNDDHSKDISFGLKNQI